MLRALGTICSWKLVGLAGVVYIGLIAAGAVYFATQAGSLVKVQRSPAVLTDPLAPGQMPS